MASISCEAFYLIDQWPGSPMTSAPLPPNGFDSSQAGNRSTTAIYPEGTKIQAYQDTTVGKGGTYVANKGYYTCMYGQYLDYTSGSDLSKGTIVVPACGSDKGRGGIAFTKDVSGGNDCSQTAPVGIVCTSIGASQYGWIWVGGVCPNADVSGLDITGFLQDGNIAAGNIITSILGHVDGTTSNFLSGPANADGTLTMLPVGFAWIDS